MPAIKGRTAGKLLLVAAAAAVAAARNMLRRVVKKIIGKITRVGGGDAVEGDVEDHKQIPKKIRV